jgi:hypothetical protein
MVRAGQPLVEVAKQSVRDKATRILEASERRTDHLGCPPVPDADEKLPWIGWDHIEPRQFLVDVVGHV